MSVKVLFLVPYPLKKAPSQRFRFEQYFKLLSQHGIRFTVSSFLKSHNWQVFYGPGKSAYKIQVIIAGVFRRVLDLFRAPFYDFIFIHREAAPLGPPIIEWLLARLLRKKIIYDFDDAIWLTDKVNESRFVRFLKWRGKIKSICRISYKISCSNDYLCSYASFYNSKVFYNPTTIDTENYHNPALHNQSKDKSLVTIGWTGSHSTLKYLKQIEPELNTLYQQYSNITFVIIADQKPDFSLPSSQFIKWNETTEVSDLMKIDIGIMPLPDDDWAKGKGGFKCLQYLSMKIPAVASAVGVNSKIINHGINGFLANTAAEWIFYLGELVKNKDIRKKMGEVGRRMVEENYSVNSNASLFLSLFE